MLAKLFMYGYYYEPTCLWAPFEKSSRVRRLEPARRAPCHLGCGRSCAPPGPSVPRRTRRVEQWGRSFAALGISYEGASMSLDLLDRKGKYSNGFCHWPQPAWIKADGSWQPTVTHVSPAGLTRTQTRTGTATPREAARALPAPAVPRAAAPAPPPPRHHRAATYGPDAVHAPAAAVHEPGRPRRRRFGFDWADDTDA